MLQPVRPSTKRGRIKRATTLPADSLLVPLIVPAQQERRR